MKRRALLVGINKYHILGELKYARQDAEAVADSLRQYCGFSELDITIMSCESEGAMLGMSRYIENSLMKLKDSTDLDLLVFGFWGHGFSPQLGQRYLCGMDTLDSDLERTAVSLEVVKAKLAQVQAANTLLILDCCQNRPSGRSTTAEPMTAGEETALTSLARDIQIAQRRRLRSSIPTVAIVNACREGEKAYEWDARKHGIFTAHLLEAFEQRFTSFAPMAAWTTDRVVKTAKDIHDRNQIPFVTIEGKGDILLAPGIAGSPSNAATDVSPPPQPRGRVEILEEPTLLIETVPDGATVSVEGEARGAAPLKLSLPAGEYRIQVERDGYQPLAKRIRFDAAGDARLQIKLNKMPRIANASLPMPTEQAPETQRADAETSGTPLIHKIRGVYAALLNKLDCANPVGPSDLCADSLPPQRKASPAAQPPRPKIGKGERVDLGSGQSFQSWSPPILHTLEDHDKWLELEPLDDFYPDDPYEQ